MSSAADIAAKFWDALYTRDWDEIRSSFTDDAIYYEANVSLPIPETKFTVSAALGYQEQDGGLDYTTWNAGVGYALTDHISLDVRYWDTDASSAADPLGYGDGRVVGGIKLAF